MPQFRGKIDDVILGCAMPEGEQGLNVARLIALNADLGIECPGQTINRFCSSGLQAIATAAGAIAIGSADVVLAGGVESMTYVPMTGFHLSASPELMEHMPGANTPMGITAENVANRFGITRQMQDEFALRSQQKAAAAQKKNVFKDEIVPVRAISFKDGKRVYTDFVVDEMPRHDTTLEGLAKLPPAFALGGSVTAGNASPLSDGAAACIVTRPSMCEHLGVKPLALFRGFAVAGVDPEIMGIGPIPAVRKLLAKHHLKVSDIELFELNEAFASQSVYCQQRARHPRRSRQRQRRRDRARSPARVHRREADGERALRAAPSRRSLRGRHDVHRWWPGRGRSVREPVVNGAVEPVRSALFVAVIAIARL